MDFVREYLASGHVDDSEMDPPVEAIGNLSRFDYSMDQIYTEVFFSDGDDIKNLYLIRYEHCTACIH
ncbi:hypothetical protein CSB45_10525 [candidate division KSB3 bacterium]|uniref:Uncharacterized protein n=1 Tax=candidate division KSB3 bacterium TaxID=2044937 RepID=A0A2G6E3J3_9BACT|nr:MAG: hypothetical protein CSB45_10525 [candidate division KSB3 bacterium]PIE29152.1 MAG: hypothetical protein CSA57_10100 [candidate division KSB3 bacterium]